MLGCIYLLKLINSIKLGRTENFEKRIIQYKPLEPTVLLCLQCKDHNKSENELLNIFKLKYKIRSDLGREYFCLDSDIKLMVFDIVNFFNDNNININIIQNIYDDIFLQKTINKTKKDEVIKLLNPVQNIKYDFMCERCGLYFEQKRVLIQHLKRKKNVCRSLVKKTEIV